MLAPSIPRLSTLALLLSSPVFSLPTSNPDYPNYATPPPRTPASPLHACSLSPAPQLPASSLPPPTYGLTLKSIVVGRGTQNYTCASAGAAPVVGGAAANLYDISCFIGNSRLRPIFDNNLTPALLRIPQDKIEKVVGGTFPCANVGQHFFRDLTTAVFQLKTGNFVNSGRVNNVATPNTAATGNANGSAVDWLKLVRKAGEPDGGIQEVYRVVTAGGRAPATCDKAGPLYVDYVAQYWFYG